jgi:hypothetical protein
LRRHAQHIPIDIIIGPVEIQHRAGRMGQQQGRPSLTRNRFAQPVDHTIFKPQRRHFGMTHSRQNIGRIAPPTMGHRNHHRNARNHRRYHRIGRFIQPRNNAAITVHHRVRSQI